MRQLTLNYSSRAMRNCGSPAHRAAYSEYRQQVIATSFANILPINTVSRSRRRFFRRGLRLGRTHRAKALGGGNHPIAVQIVAAELLDQLRGRPGSEFGKRELPVAVQIALENHAGNPGGRRDAGTWNLASGRSGRLRSRGPAVGSAGGLSAAAGCVSAGRCSPAPDCTRRSASVSPAFGVAGSSRGGVFRRCAGQREGRTQRVAAAIIVQPLCQFIKGYHTITIRIGRAHVARHLPPLRRLKAPVAVCVILFHEPLGMANDLGRYRRPIGGRRRMGLGCAARQDRSGLKTGAGKTDDEENSVQRFHGQVFPKPPRFRNLSASP